MLLSNGHVYDLETEETTDLTQGEGGFEGIIGQSEDRGQPEDHDPLPDPALQAAEARGTAPIAVFVSGHLSAPHGGISAQLQRMTVQVNKHGLLQSRGLPACGVASFDFAEGVSMSARVEKACTVRE